MDELAWGDGEEAVEVLEDGVFLEGLGSDLEAHLESLDRWQAVRRLTGWA